MYPSGRRIAPGFYQCSQAAARVRIVRCRRSSVGIVEDPVGYSRWGGEFSPIRLPHDGGTTDSSSDGLVCREFLDLNAFRGRVMSSAVTWSGVDLVVCVFSTYWVSPAGRYIGMFEASSGVTQGL